MPPNEETDTGQLDAGVSSRREIKDARGQDVYDEAPKDGVGDGQPPSLHPGTGSDELGDQPSQRVAALEQLGLIKLPVTHGETG